MDATDIVVMGLNCHHADAAACLLVDGRVVAASEEERHRRVKHYAGFPSEAVRFCLAEAGLTIADIDHVAINRDPRAALASKVAGIVTHPRRWAGVLGRLRNRQAADNAFRQLGELALDDAALRAQIHRVEHHRAHLASAYYASPFERAAVVSIDGFGDYTSTMWGQGNGRSIRVMGSVQFPHSLGHFYLAMTQYLGFPSYGDEYKVMGLAAYGEPRYLEEMRRVVTLRSRGRFALTPNYFRHHREHLPMRLGEDGTPIFEPHYTDAWVELLGPSRQHNEPVDQRHRDLAASAQAMYEEALFHVLRHVRAVTGDDDLCLAGGCAMNSVANGKVADAVGFERVFVQPAGGDAGGAMGAAMWTWNEVLGRPRSEPLQHAYLGPRFDRASIERALRDHDLWEDARRDLRDEDELCRVVADRIAAGAVVGWFQGRCEWGPRALGNRSILADPRRGDMREILNVRTKRRESFRPFAPSILREAVPDWFEGDADVPFMTHVLPIRPDRRDRIPAVTHVDGTGRLQTVTREQNPRYHRLIQTFYESTGVPILLNTSFNESEPIVCAPEEAIQCFLRTKMDLLVLGDYVLERPRRELHAEHDRDRAETLAPTAHGSSSGGDAEDVVEPGLAHSAQIGDGGGERQL